MAFFGLGGAKNTAEATIRVGYKGNQAKSGLAGLKKLIGTLVSAYVLKRLAAFTYELGKLGAQSEMVEKNFANLADMHNRSVDSMMGKLRKATMGMVDDMTLQQQAMKALIGGVKFDDLIVAMEYVTKFASATGMSVNEKMNTVMTGLARKSAMFLDDVGIQVMGAEDVIGAAMEQMKQKMDTFATSEEDAATQAAQLKADFENLKQMLGQELLPYWSQFNNFLLDSVRLFTWLIKTRKENVEQMRKNEEFQERIVKLGTRRRFLEAEIAKAEREGLDVGRVREDGRLIRLTTVQKALETTKKKIREVNEEFLGEGLRTPTDPLYVPPEDKTGDDKRKKAATEAERAAQRARTAVLEESLAGRYQLLTEQYDAEKALLLKHGKSTLDLDKWYEGERVKLVQEADDAILADKAELLDLEIQRAEEKVAAARKTEEQIREEIEKTIATQREQAAQLQSVMTSIQSFNSSLMALSDAVTAKQIRNLDKQKMGQEEYDKAVEKIQAEAEERAKVFARAQQAIIVARAISDAIAAGIGAAKDTPGGAITRGLSMAAMIAAAFVEVAVIEAQTFAKGTRSAPGGWAWVGEQGPELMKVPRGAEVLTAGESSRTANDNRSYGGDTMNFYGLSDEQMRETIRDQERRQITGTLI